jgi:hypothetical protein
MREEDAMETARFDQIAARLARPHTRRGALRLFGAALLGAGGIALVGGQANAASRKMAIAQANAFIEDCFADGGEPDATVDDESGYVTATCGHGDDVETSSCTYYYDDPNPFCYSDRVTQPGSGVRPIGLGGAVAGNLAAGGNAGSSPIKGQPTMAALPKSDDKVQRDKRHGRNRRHAALQDSADKSTVRHAKGASSKNDKSKRGSK